MEAASKSNLKEVTLELGGKNPSIIFDDADIEQAVNWTVHGILYVDIPQPSFIPSLTLVFSFNQGQACAAGSKIFLHAKIHDDFLARFTARCKALSVGNPFSAETTQGPQTSQAHYDRIMSYIDSGKQEGATVHFGGARHGTEGYFIQPTIFTDVKPEMKIAREEIFGPVGVFIKFDDDDDIVYKANDSVYGLAAAVFSKDIDRALSTAHKLKAGTVWVSVYYCSLSLSIGVLILLGAQVNCVTYTYPNVPYGGFKSSGVGRELGEYALKK